MLRKTQQEKQQELDNTVVSAYNALHGWRTA
jgi:hypothetical protein